MKKLKKRTGLPRGTFSVGDAHPWLHGLVYKGWQHGNEYWTTPDVVQRRSTEARNWHRDNKGRQSVYNKRYRIENKAKVAKSKSDWYKRNKGRVAERSKNWYTNNLESRLAHSASRRAATKDRLKDLSEGEKDVVKGIYAQVLRLNSIFKQTVFHVDHTVPLSLGGLHEPSNLQIVPAKWNLEKSNSSSERWGVPYGQ